MYFVYIVRSVKYPEKLYIGYTEDLKSRLAKHNTGGSVFTKKYLPWNLAFYASFPEKSIAVSFEAYLKSHSGRSFIQKRLLL